MIINFVLVLLGLGLLMAGGEALIRGSVAIANRAGMSRAMIGATLVGFGTSMPEFVASFGAAALNQDGIALGNVIGSDIVNLLLILGACSLVYPMITPRDRLGLDFAFVMLASLACLLIIQLGYLPRGLAGALLALFVIYMVQLFRADPGAMAEDVPLSSISIAAACVFSIIGIGFLIGGAEVLIRGASGIARTLGVSEAIIGITIVGIGTSAPELSASLVASFKKENAIAFGNIIGSNIFNVFAVLGITGLVFDIDDLAGFSKADGYVLVIATIAMFAFAATRQRIARPEGAALCLAYLAYLIWLIMRASASI